MSAPAEKNLYLTGFMGCGKTTVARAFRELYGREIIEMDERIAEEAGMTIPEIFARQGEEAFRAMETSLLDSLQDKKGLVVSCGGGAVLRQENVDRMRQNGCIVCLKASPEVILERVSRNNDRPVLEGKKTLSGIRELMESRRPAYERAASLVIETDGKSAAEICEEILQAL